MEKAPQKEIWGVTLAQVTVWHTGGLSTGRAENFSTDMGCVPAQHACPRSIVSDWKADLP
jgi:hypothetical protein